MTDAEYIGILYVSPDGLKVRKDCYTVYTLNASEDVAAMARDEAVLAGENARLLVEIEDGETEIVREGMRRRLARTLVQLGMKIDPLVGDESRDDA
jgi:hypothetical protein